MIFLEKQQWNRDAQRKIWENQYFEQKTAFFWKIIAPNRLWLKLFSPIFVLLIPETQKLCVRLFLFLYSPFHTTTHRSAHVARVVSNRTPRPPPRLRPQSLFPPVNTQTAFQKFIKLISRRSHRSQPTIPRPNYFSRIFEFLIPRNAKKDIFTSRNF